MCARFLGALVLAIVMAALTPLVTPSTARAAGGCDASGAGTDRLCAGAHLNVNQYLRSSNRRYRFYYQDDGHTLIYDTIDWNNWQHSAPIFEPHPHARYLSYGVDSREAPTTQVTLWSFSGWQRPALPYYIFWGDAQALRHYLKLDDDGCLRAYESDGSFLMNVWC